MQGRLLPPVGNTIQAFPGAGWRSEFASARSCGLELIEWIFEAPQWPLNPLVHESGRAAIGEAIRASGVSVETVCADYFQQERLFGVRVQCGRAAVAMLLRLIECCAKLGVRALNIPFVDNSALRTDDDIAEAKDMSGNN